MSLALNTLRFKSLIVYDAYDSIDLNIHHSP